MGEWRVRIIQVESYLTPPLYWGLIRGGWMGYGAIVPSHRIRIIPLDDDTEASSTLTILPGTPSSSLPASSLSPL